MLHYKGWIYCRDNADACVDIVLNAGTALGKGHMTWMMNEVNALIWPSEEGIGVMYAEDWVRTARISQEFGIISQPPSNDIDRTDLAREALKGISDDTTGLNWTKAEVEVTIGGE